MSFLSGGVKKQAQQQPSYTGLDIQTSAAGKAIAIAVGTIRLAPNILWYGNFQSHKHESSSGGAGKGGNSGASGSVSYTYSASVIMGLSEGPINGIGKVWVGKSLTTLSKLGMSFFAGTYPQNPWGYLASNYGSIAEPRTVPSSAPYQLLANESSTFLTDEGVGMSSSLALVRVSGTPTAYQYQQSGNVYTFNASNAGASVVISYQTVSFQFGAGRLVAEVVTATIPTKAPFQVSVTSLTYDKGVTINRHTLTEVSGSPGATEYSVTSGGLYTFNAANAGHAVTLNYTAFSVDSQALRYNGISYAAVANYNLGDSPDLSNHNFEVYGFYSNSVPGSVAADPSLFVADYLTSPHWGVGFPSDRLGDTATYQCYALSANLLVSFSLDQQQTASQILADLMTATNAEFVWSEGILNIVPYGDEAITGNGKAYTPPSEPLFDLTDDDFVIESAGDDPVLLTRMRPADAYNDVQVEYLDRTNAYNTAIAEATDQAGVDAYGLRTVSGSGTHIFADGACAQMSA